ncbi:MAG: hypothetical protein ACUVTR_00235 [Dehalococcoidia bacterium]
MKVEKSYDDVNRLRGQLGQAYNWGFININPRRTTLKGARP